MILGFSVIPGLIGCVVLLGWWTDIDALKRLGMATVTMNPAVACCFIIITVALFLSRSRRLAALWAGRLLLVLAAVPGATKLTDTFSGYTIGMDTWVFTSRLASSGLRPSRMAPNAAMCFVLTVLALILIGPRWKMMRAPRVTAVAQALALASSCIGVFAVVGYIYHVGAFYSVAAFHPIAVHTAICFLCLSGAVFLQTSSSGLIAPISDRGPAGRSSRALLPAAIVLPILVGWLRQQAEKAGLFAPEMGIAVMVMAMVLIFTALIWCNARQLLVMDTSRLAAEAELARMAHNDFLTGLPNRACFMENLMARLSPGRWPPGQSFAIIYMDLDGFKQVNDRLGHAAGDALLREVGTHLQTCCLDGCGIVARLGGDEFAMLLDDIGAPEDATQVARRIVDGMPAHYGPAGQLVPVGMSLGVVIADVASQSAEALLSQADQALYDAKRAGKGRFSLRSGKRMAS
jgi:diguanylate cyclase (GGDEF)-like protein